MDSNSRPAERLLRGRIRVLTWIFIIGLLISGVTAIPLRTEVDWLAEITGAAKFEKVESAPSWAKWLLSVQRALRDVGENHPLLFYGTDWLAFGHIVIAIAFVGALRDPVRNRWLFAFGQIACFLVIPFAFVMGGWRGIPIWWRLIDCSFGVFGFIPLWLCWRWSGVLERRGVESAPESVR